MDKKPPAKPAAKTAPLAGPTAKTAAPTAKTAAPAAKTAAPAAKTAAPAAKTAAPAAKPAAAAKTAAPKTAAKSQIVIPAPVKTIPAKAAAPAPKNSASAFYTFVSAAILVLTVFILVCVAVLTAGLVRLTRERANSNKERAVLREKAETRSDEAPAAEPEAPAPEINAFDAEMLEINPDYICWLKIDGTQIDYPVARAADNGYYLNMSFSGEKNAFGSVFMDYRCAGEFVPHIILYGHNAKTGEMFGGLRKFLDKKYLKAHPTITLTANGRVCEYEIFAARKTNVNDFAYNLSFENASQFAAFAEKCGAPQDAGQILTLSTCVSGTDKNERVIVQGALLEER